MRVLAAVVVGMGLVASPALAQVSQPAQETVRSYSFFDAAGESLFGDVYAQPSKWKPLSAGSFFSEGWNRPWASPPAGEGGAPRQGWLNAFDGVFYRLGIVTGGLAHDFNDNDNRYTANLQLYLPLSARFEVRLDVPFLNANRAGADNDYRYSFGDLTITPRFLISESQNFTQSLNLSIRMPSGDNDTFTGIGAVSPTWEFWWNPWAKLVLRGGLGFALPYTDSDTTRNLFISNLAAGYYLTPHSFTPFGDLVLYLSANLLQPIDDRGPHETIVTLTPGIRHHLGMNWYMLGAVEVPVTSAKPFDFQVLWGVMKVF